jgi:hypothetical protein
LDDTIEFLKAQRKYQGPKRDKRATHNFLLSSSRCEYDDMCHPISFTTIVCIGRHCGRQYLVIKRLPKRLQNGVGDDHALTQATHTSTFLFYCFINNLSY